MEYFNAGYKNVIYERRFIIVCSNISYKPFNLNFSVKIYFFFQKEYSLTVISQKSVSEYIAYIKASWMSSPMSTNVC